MNKLKETKILGFPLWMYLIFSILMMVMAANDWMLTNMVGALAFAMIIGTLLGWVGDHIPVWKTWFGGGMLFSCLVAGAMNTFHLISIINHANLGFSIHTFAFMVILMAILNMTNILPENVKAGARGMQQFFVKYMSFPLMITVGIGTNLADYAKVFTNPAYIVIIMATVIGAMIGTFIVGKLFHFYPVEGMLTAGLCMANGGGAGDVQCLGAAHRMELMSYAQISSRIGGAIMLVIASFIFGKFL